MQQCVKMLARLMCNWQVSWPLTVCLTHVPCRYLLAICRGLIQEGSRGSRRCIGPRDMDLVSTAKPGQLHGVCLQMKLS
jgi:hypothetical protein